MILALSILDSDFVIEASGALCDQVAALFPGSSSGGTRHDVIVGADGVRMDGLVLPHGGLGPLENLLTQLNAVVLQDCRGFAIHAGVVARGRAAVAFPAISGTGKSTLVAACLRVGLEYVSDEALVVDWAVPQIRPYVKPLSLTRQSQQLLGQAVSGSGPDKDAFNPEAFGSQTRQATLSLEHVVVLERHETATEIIALPRAQAADLLMRMSFNHYRNPVRAFELVAAMAHGANASVLRYADPTSGAEAVLDLTRSDPS